MSIKFNFRTYLALILIPFLLSGCALFDFVHKYKDISEPPKKGGTNKVIPPRLSSLQPLVKVPLKYLEVEANKATSNVLPIHEKDSETIYRWRVDKPWPFNGCWICGTLDLNWNYDAKLTSPISVSGSSNRMEIKIPARVDGKVGLSGAIAEWLSLNGKNFNAGVIASFSSGFGTDSRFCPKIKETKIKYDWTDDPSFQIFGQSCIWGLCVGPWDYNLAPYFDPAIRRAIPQVENQINENLPCEPVRDELKKLWVTRSLPISIPYSENMYVNLIPDSMYIPDVQIDANNLSIMGKLDLQLSVDTQPLEEKIIPLPENVESPISPGEFRIAVPVNTKYYTLEALAKQSVIGQKFTENTPLGIISVRPKSVSIYPSEERIAIGVSFILDYQYRLFNTSGTVWFAGQPEASENGEGIYIKNITLTRKFNNPIWSVASLLLENNVQQAISDGFFIDLTKSLSDAESQLTDSLNKAGEDQGFELITKDVSIRIGEIITNDSSLQVEGLLKANVEASLGLPPF